MAMLIFHGPNDSDECRRQVRALAKEFGGKFSYNSFWNGKRGTWHSDNTVGKAAYCVRLIPLHISKFQINPIDRKKAAAIVRDLRKRQFTGGLKYFYFT